MRARLSYPPKRWRTFVPFMGNGAPVWVIRYVEAEPFPYYTIDGGIKKSEYLAGVEKDEFNRLMVVAFDGKEPETFHCTRVFDNRYQAEVEATNLSLWMELVAQRLEMARMAKKWPAEEVSESGVLLPDGLYTVKVVDATEEETRNGKYMIRVRTRLVTNPKNQPFNFQFVIGTDDDPTADDLNTWRASFSASRYKSMLVAAEVPPTGDVEEELDNLKGRRFVIDIGHHEDESGRRYNDANAFYREGSAAEAEPARRAPAAAKKSAPPAPAPDADDDADDWE